MTPENKNSPKIEPKAADVKEPEKSEEKLKGPEKAADVKGPEKKEPSKARKGFEKVCKKVGKPMTGIGAALGLVGAVLAILLPPVGLILLAVGAVVTAAGFGAETVASRAEKREQKAAHGELDTKVKGHEKTLEQHVEKQKTHEQDLKSNYVRTSQIDNIVAKKVEAALQNYQTDRVKEDKAPKPEITNQPHRQSGMQM